MLVGRCAAGGEGDDAEGFVEGWVNHWAPPHGVGVRIAVLSGYRLSETVITLAPNVELPRSFLMRMGGSYARAEKPGQ